MGPQVCALDGGPGVRPQSPPLGADRALRMNSGLIQSFSKLFPWKRHHRR